MKIFKSSLLLTLILCFTINFSQAQKRYQVHVDNVKPSMVGEYEKISKQFLESCKKHNPQTSWITATTSDFRYMWVSPMENFAELDKDPFSDMSKAMGDDWGKIFEDYNKCYDSHSDFIITLSESLTYMPEGISQTQEGQNHRKYYYIYFTPENAKTVYDGMKGVKDMFASKGSKEYYRVYRSGFGNPENYYLVAISSKDEVDAATRGKANEELLGDGRHEVFGKLMQGVSRMEEYTGAIRPDLGYKPTE
jgi:hypothetical protein